MSLLRHFAPKYQFPLLRIDDRLIHGQVILGWAMPLKIRPLLLVHDRIANDEDLKTAISAIVPANLDFSVLMIAEAVPMIIDPSLSRHMMIVVESPGVALQLWEQGAALKSINIGGLHFEDDRIKLLSYVFMSRDEIDQVARLTRSGADVHCQDLPTTIPVAWEKLVEKLDIS
jgi:mannose/fructose/N-acetylgalactosamine-specific phosphotransferase system component IIB